jgi:NADPH-dependent 2,4-dienoyl-CoA reductase/sulfur reductase-like enzyme
MGLSALSMSGVDTKNVMTRIRSVVQKAYEKDLPETFREIGIDVLSGAASFSDPHHIVIDGRSISSEKFIIAVGTRPLVPPIKGLRELDYLTNENLYELETLAVYDGISGKIKVTDTNDRDAWPYLKPWAAHFSYFTREKVWHKILRDVINR